MSCTSPPPSWKDRHRREQATLHQLTLPGVGHDISCASSTAPCERQQHYVMIRHVCLVRPIHHHHQLLAPTVQQRLACTVKHNGIWDIAGAVGNLVSCHHPCGTVNPRRAPTPGFGCHTGCPVITQACTCTTYRALPASRQSSIVPVHKGGAPLPHNALCAANSDAPPPGICSCKTLLFETSDVNPFDRAQHSGFRCWALHLHIESFTHALLMQADSDA
jgi:hypothetical protein